MTERISDERLEGLRQFARVYIGVNLSMISLPCRDVDAVIEELQQARAQIAALTLERDDARAGLFHRITGWDPDGQQASKMQDEVQILRDQVVALMDERDAQFARAERLLTEESVDSQTTPTRDGGPDERLMAHLRRRTLEATKDREAVDELDWYLSKGDTKRLARVTQAVQEYLREAWGLPND